MMSPQQSKIIESHSEKLATRMINMRILEKSELDIDYVLVCNKQAFGWDKWLLHEIKARKNLYTGYKLSKEQAYVDTC